MTNIIQCKYTPKDSLVYSHKIATEIFSRPSSHQVKEGSIQHHWLGVVYHSTYHTVIGNRRCMAGGQPRCAVCSWCSPLGHTCQYCHHLTGPPSKHQLRHSNTGCQLQLKACMQEYVGDRLQIMRKSSSKSYRNWQTIGCSVRITIPTYVPLP